MNTEERLPEKAQENNVVAIGNQSPMDAMAMALSHGADLDKLERMLALQEKWDQMEAKKAFTQAMAEFKSNPPLITKDKINNQYRSNYTSLGNLVNSSLPRMSECGLSHKWEIDQEQQIKVTCIVTHHKGHFESTSMSAPADGSCSKNPIQQIKSTITYLKACTFESIMGLASTDANFDDDGNASGKFQNKSVPAKKPFIKQIKEVKESDPKAYKTACDKWQMDSLDGITDAKAQDGILREIELYKTDEWKAWEDLRNNNYDLLETWPDPVDAKQCVQAVEQANKVINES